ncbi:Fe-S protein assembly co-chaperone HscB [Magnetospira sp. QH-2]|uniref:Fe-S protein assembly co-chaperone HscB n=1 Tax=Magnetospira sp. (strain QH-2) TaxID=1288970 RepID=UPI0003E812C7|nr:Fe-S protein assembly co-chaperone HscB [Magnetospira sp. QH-2]CCQ74484.1 molecular chaperone protein containing DnaJ domain [Magnetospira sp. QH-2]
MNSESPISLNPELDKAARSRVIPCWSCAGPVGGSDLFCPTCDAVQPPGQADHFARLGLPIDFDVDVEALDREYFALQRRLHPDRFATKTSREKAFSMQQATSLNEAYECLKDSLCRADYMVRIRGVEVMPEGCNLVNDQELLMEAMEMREALAEAETMDDIAQVVSRAESDMGDCLKRLSATFKTLALEEACRLTTRLKYLRKLSDEARQRKVQLSMMR